jgi:ribosomal protein S6--L-glutamate ligase
VTLPLRGMRIGFLERPHPPGYAGGLTERLVPLLAGAGARIEVVHAEVGAHRLDCRPAWDLVVLKSGSAAALHLSAAAEAWGIRSVNAAEATRLAQDKLAAAAILQTAGLPIAPGYLVWLGPGVSELGQRLGVLNAGAWVVKAARGSQGIGLWSVAAGELVALATSLPAGPYLLMEHVPHAGDDLKVFVAGSWSAAIERPFPATTLAAKSGRPVPLPPEVAAVACEAGRQLRLRCYGCDFVRGAAGWILVDVNAFPGYKGAADAPAALAAEITRFAVGAEGAEP